MKERSVMRPDEIGREEIQQITGASKARIQFFSCNNDYGFPARKRLVNRRVVFDRKLVLEWLSKNDPNKIIIKGKSSYKKTRAKKKSFNDMAVNFLITGLKKEPKKINEKALANKYKPIKHKVVHVKEVHEQTELRKIDCFAQIHDFNHRVVT